MSCCYLFLLLDGDVYLFLQHCDSVFPQSLIVGETLVHLQREGNGTEGEIHIASAKLEEQIS